MDFVRVAISKIELENVGPWGGRHVFEIPEEGFAILVAPNESGKTTFLRSVAAILWNFMPPSFHWYASQEAPFRGSVYLVHRQYRGEEMQGVRHFRITRDFHSNGVVAEEQDASGRWRDVFRGKHRARGRTPDQIRWREKDIARLFAPITPEAFSHVAVISQPWNYEVNAKLIEELIVGPGQTSGQEVRERLVARYRSITRFSRQAGIHTHDGQKPGMLDELQAEVNRLRDDLKSFVSELNKLRQIEESLSQLQARLNHQQKELDAVTQQLETIDGFRRLRRELANAEEEAERLEKVCRRVENLEGQLQALTESLASFPTEFINNPLSTLESWLANLQEWRLKRLKLKSEKEINEAKERLTREFAELERFPFDAAQRIRRYLEAYRQAEAWRGKRRELETRLAELAPRVDRKRQALVASLVGGATGIIVLAVFLVILLNTVAAQSQLVLIVAALAAAGASASAAGLAAWTAITFYRPELIPPGYHQAQEDLELAVFQQTMAEAALDEADKQIGFAPTRDPVQLAQLAERHERYCREADAWRQMRDDQERLRAELATERLPGPLQHLLQRANNDPQQAEHLLREIVKLRQELESKTKERTALLESCGCQRRDQLDKKLTEAIDRRQNLRRDLEALVRSSATAEALIELLPEKLDDRVRELTKRRNELEAELQETKKTIEDTKTEYARQEGILARFGEFNAAQTEIRLKEMERQIQALSQQANAVRQAYRLLDEAESSFATSHKASLENAINKLMQDWTGQQNRLFRVGPRLALHWELVVSAGANPATGNRTFPCDIRTLSQGAWDQLALAIRLAVLDLMAGAVVLPLLLDDAFLTWDATRRDRFRQGLQRLLRRRQVILVTHDETFLDWGQPIKHTTLP